MIGQLQPTILNFIQTHFVVLHLCLGVLSGRSDNSYEGYYVQLFSHFVTKLNLYLNLSYSLQITLISVFHFPLCHSLTGLSLLGPSSCLGFAPHPPSRPITSGAAKSCHPARRMAGTVVGRESGGRATCED